MIWLTLGIIGLIIFFGLIFLVPVWIGAMDIKEMSIVFTAAISATAFLFLASWAFVTGYNQLFG